jgi:glyoxylate/hydroxypyruvate reductase
MTVVDYRCAILPHIGSATIETRIEMATLAVKNLLAGISGQTLPASVNLVGN